MLRSTRRAPNVHSFSQGSYGANTDSNLVGDASKKNTNVYAALARSDQWMAPEHRPVGRSRCSGTEPAFPTGILAAAQPREDPSRKGTRACQ